MGTIFNSLDRNFKTPTGPISKGSTLMLRIRLPKYYNPYNAQVTFYEHLAGWNSFSFPMEYEKSDEKNVYFKVELSNLKVNIYYYYFSFNDSQKFVKMCNDSWEGYVSDNFITHDWQLTVYEPMNIHPNMQNGIMYQIFPDRFYKSNLTKSLPVDRVYRTWGELPYYHDRLIGSDFFCGDLKGIIQKLDYLKELNVSVLYLNPIWEAQSNHRYNTGSYEIVDPVLGNMDDLKHLIYKAHSLGMIVILDTVLNHTGSDSIYFNKYRRYPVNGAYNDSNSLFYNWYYFHGNKDNYESWWGFDTLPKVNQNNPDFINYFFGIRGIIDKWYDLGVDGLRLDVADELENATLEKIYDASTRNRNSITIIGEVWDNASNKCNYGHRMNYFLGHELTSVMNYPVKDVLLAYIRYGSHWAYNFKRTLLSVFVEDYPKEVAHSLMNFLSSHDTVRAITKLAGAEVDNHDKDWQFLNDTLSRDEYLLGRSRLLISYLILYFLPGIPSIFYGDEIGLSGQKDPFCRKCFTWDRIDKKILNFIKKLGKVRRSLADFLTNADFDVCEADDEKCIISRFSDTRMVFVFVNRQNHKIYQNIPFYILNNTNGRTQEALNTFLRNYSCEFKTIFTLGNSDITCIDAYGATVVEVIFN